MITQVYVRDLNTWTSDYFVGIGYEREWVANPKSLFGKEQKKSLYIVRKSYGTDFDCDVVDDKGRWHRGKIIDAYAM